MLYTADFETTTTEDDCRVWAWGVCEINESYRFTHGNNIDGFIAFLEGSENSTFYFHNLKFDGEFIFVWLFEHGFKHTFRKEDRASKTFNTLISDMGQFYSIEIIFEIKGKRTRKATLYDSLKILPFSVDQVAKGFNLPINKLEIDYESYREIGYLPTAHEIEYLKHDVEIMARALNVLFRQGLTKMTQGSNALYDFKNTIGEKKFKRNFPTPDYDNDIRPSYKGGFTYVSPTYKEMDIGEGLVFDVNSLYPSVMHDCPLPFGKPIFFSGKYEEDKLYPLYIQMFECQFELKERHIPTIQIKKGGVFVPNEYITSSKDRFVTLCLTSVDLKLFFEHYDVFNITYFSGWKFMATTGLFNSYIDKWTDVKIEATKTGNKAMRTLAKLMLNALYGKFALKPNVRSKYPYYNEGKISYTKGEEEQRDPLYLPVGTFVTAWARHKTITTAQKVYDMFVYADTDSLHLRINLPDSIRSMSNEELEKLTTSDLQSHGVPLPDDFEVDPVALGAWKLESKFNRARFLRQKSYIEDWNPPHTWDAQKYSSKELKELCKEKGLDYEVEKQLRADWYDTDLLNITCAGMPKSCYPYVTWENFRILSSFQGKLTPKHVKGGIVLVDTIFTIKPS